MKVLGMWEVMPEPIQARNTRRLIMRIHRAVYFQLLLLLDLKAELRRSRVMWCDDRIDGEMYAEIGERWLFMSDRDGKLVCVSSRH